MPPALLVLLYLPGLAGGRLLFLRDIGSHQLGWRLLWADAVVHGRLPLWDPLTLGGTPMLANPNTLALYPPTLLFLLPSPAVAVALFVLLHQLLLGLGTVLLLRRLGFRREAVLAGAAATAGSGLAFSQAAFMTGPAVVAWIPFLLASAVGPGSPGRLPSRRVAEAAGAGAMLLLAGKPAVAVLAWAVWGVLVFARLGLRPGRWSRAAAAPLLAAALAAPQILPAMQILPRSWRGGGGTPAAAVAADAFSPRRWPELVLPRLHGRPAPELPGGFWAAPSFPWQRYELDLHLGTIVLALLLLSARRREGRPWLLGAAVLAVPAACPGLVLAARRILPPLHLFRYAIKFLLPAVMVLAPAVAAGFEAAWERPRSFRCAALALGLVLVPVAALSLSPELLRRCLELLYPASASNLALPGVAAAVGRDLRIDVAVALLPLLAAALAPRRLLIAAMAVQLVAGGCWVLAWDSWAVWRTPPAAAQAVAPGAAVLELYRAPVPVADSAAARDPVRRHFRRLRAGLARHYGILWDVGYRGVSGPDGTEPAWMRVMAARLEQASPLEAARAARHLGAGWMVTDQALPPGPGWSGRAPLPEGPPGAALYRLDRTMPKVWLAREVVAVPSEAALWQTLTDPDSVPGVRAVVVGIRPPPVDPGGSCRVLRRRPGDWTVRTETAGPALLVVNQADSVLWRARTEAGRVLPTVRVNGFLLGVEVPAGRHTVRLTVDHRRFRLGLVLFLPALLVTALLAVGAPTRGRRTPSGEAAPTLPASPPVR